MINRELPDGYKRLDYIEVTGTQYIDTGIIPNQDTRIVCEALWTGGNGIYGARTAVASNNFALRVINSKWQSGYSTVSTSSVAVDNEWHTFAQNKNAFSVDGVLVTTHDTAEFTAPAPIALGGIKTASAMYYGKGRYRKCQIYDNGVRVRDLIPCLDPNGESGMYDLLNDVFYGNAGTGTFVAGEEKYFVTNREQNSTYEYTDLNRVEIAVAEIAAIFPELGISEILTTKTDWKLPDDFSVEAWPVQSQMARYLSNVRKIKEIFVTAFTLPTSMDSLTYSGANKIEKVLQTAFERISAIQKTYKYSGELYAGEE